MWRRFVLGLVVGLMALTPMPAGADEGLEQLEDEDVHELLRILTQDAGWRFVEVRAAALASLKRVVESGDDWIVDAALRRIESGTPQQRRHAQLVLTQAESLPRERLETLRASSELEPWAFATISTLEACPEIQTHDDPSLYRRLGAFERDPLHDVGWGLRSRLDDLAETERRDPRPARMTIGPRVSAVDVYPDRQWLVDLDGDGREECVVVDVPTWPEGYEPERFICVLGRDTDDGPWRLRDVKRLDDSNHRRSVTVMDLDRDGDAEILIRYDWAGGWCWDYLAVVDAGTSGWIHDVSQTHFGAQAFILQRNQDEAPIIVTPAQYVEGATGKAVCLVGVLGFECALERWNDGAAEPVGRVYVGRLPE